MWRTLFGLVFATFAWGEMVHDRMAETASRTMAKELLVVRKTVRYTARDTHVFRMLVAVAALILSSVAAAGTTIKTVVAYDALACRQFLDMAKAAGIPEMSDAQLCDFRFERLSPSVAKHFAAIDWKPLKVEDPVAMYGHMWIANKGVHVVDGPQWSSLMNATRDAAADHNLGFYTAQVQLQGKGPVVTVLKADVVRGCSVLPQYLKDMPIPFYAVYKGPSLQHPIPFWLPPENTQMMLWKNKGLRIPVLTEVSPWWIRAVGMSYYFNQLTLQSLIPSPLNNSMYPDTIYNYGRCDYNLTSKTKPLGTDAAIRESQP